MSSAFDFAPLFRSSVGFDRLAQLLDLASRGDETKPGFSPYNIETRGEDAYRVTLAVAGFRPEDLSVEVREQSLVISGKAPGEDGGDRRVLHRGIAGQSFRRTFQLADRVQVSGARLENGLLYVDLVRIVPQAAPPRRIPIVGGAAVPPATITALTLGSPKAA
jgi:molecular chaperone IbpA